jgi:hypothetical protein
MRIVAYVVSTPYLVSSTRPGQRKGLTDLSRRARLLLKLCTSPLQILEVEPAASVPYSRAGSLQGGGLIDANDAFFRI